LSAKPSSKVTGSCPAPEVRGQTGPKLRNIFHGDWGEKCLRQVPSLCASKLAARLCENTENMVRSFWLFEGSNGTTGYCGWGGKKRLAALKIDSDKRFLNQALGWRTLSTLNAPRAPKTRNGLVISISPIGGVPTAAGGHQDYRISTCEGVNRSRYCVACIR